MSEITEFAARAEAMIAERNKRIAEAAAFLDALAADCASYATQHVGLSSEQFMRTAAECRAMASKLRGET